MKSVTIQINDLFEFEGQPVPAQRPDRDVVEAMARRQFEFLRQPLQIEVGESAVTVSFNEESTTAQDEAIRLAKRGSQRAGEGNYEKAISIFKRVLELMPSLHLARRDLAMSYMETGDVESAINHLIEVLRFDPQDVWSWVVLANLYIREKRDKETGEKFIRRALAIAPDDAWALNSLAAMTHERGQTEEAIALFEKAIAANPDFANSYYGEAVTYSKAGQPEKAGAVLERMFRRAKVQDIRSQAVYQGARQLFAKIQGELAERNEPEIFKVVENFRAGLETLSGYPVRVTEGEFKDKTSAMIQMAWKHGRDHHLIKFRTGLPGDLRTHQMAHELSHLQLEVEARQAGKNRFLVTTYQSEQSALKRIEGDLRKLERKGYPAAASKDLALALVRGLAGFLFNCPLDMLIETRLRERLPALSAAQFGALRMGALEALESQRNPEILEVTPKLILRAGAALNGAYALFLDKLFHGATTYALAYQRAESYTVSQRLFQHWQTRHPQLGPGDEYALVDEFADMIGVRGW